MRGAYPSEPSEEGGSLSLTEESSGLAVFPELNFRSFSVLDGDRGTSLVMKVIELDVINVVVELQTLGTVKTETSR